MTSAFTFTTLGTAVFAAGTTFARVVGGVAVIPLQLTKGLVQILRAKRHRIDVMTMLEMDDRMLRDIGLTRMDVASALASPASMDPSTRLRVFAVERRAGIKAQARERQAEFEAMKSAETAARCALATE